jgi:hypothetical protein
VKTAAHGPLKKSAEKLSAERHEAFFSEHFPYEIGMMRYAYEKIVAGNFDQGDHNAMIETFCIHARNIIALFKTHESCDFDPRYFVKPDFRINTQFIKDGLLSKINNQISHLTKGRTELNQKKIGPEDWKDIFDSIQTEIARFEAALVDERKSVWEAAKIKWTFPVPKIFVGATLGATNHISTTHAGSVTGATGAHQA